MVQQLSKPSTIQFTRALLVLLTLGLFNLLFVVETNSISNLSDYFPWRCPLHFISGFFCPGCGMVRGLILAASGQITASLSYNPIALPSLLFSSIYFSINGLRLPSRKLLNTCNPLALCLLGVFAFRFIWLNF